MAIDISEIVYIDDPEWLKRVTTVNGSDDGEILAISPEFLKEAKGHDTANGSVRRNHKSGKELLELMLGK